MRPERHALTRFCAVSLCAAFSLTGCNFFTRMATIGQEPPLTAIEDPTLQRDYKPVSMPMPPPDPTLHQPNSLWRPGARHFFKDQRASRIGDIVTVNVRIDEKAEVSNSTARTRTNSETAGISRFLGYESSLNAILPEAVDPSKLVEADSDSGSRGDGSVEREEQIVAEVAAVVTQVLPNGNFVIQGRQEVRVNFELRELQVSGVIRPEDITATNTINHTQIAEARIVYGGRGVLSDVQQPRYGQQLFDIIFPW
jgi:flagellar L-ring protein precursor FlgH